MKSIFTACGIVGLLLAGLCVLSASGQEERPSRGPAATQPAGDQADRGSRKAPAASRPVGPAKDAVTGTLKLAVQDEAGQPMVARVCLQESSGLFVRPADAPSTYSTEHGGPFADEYFYVDGQVSLPVAAGQAKLILMHGADYAIAQETVEIPASGEVQCTITMKRLVDPTQRGYWASETHLHRPMNELIMRGEGLNVALSPQCHTHQLSYKATTPPAPLPDTEHIYGRCHAIEGNCFMWDLPTNVSVTVAGQPWEGKVDQKIGGWKDTPYVQPFIYRAVDEAGGMIVPYMNDASKRLPGGYYPLYMAMGWVDAYGILENVMAKLVNNADPQTRMNAYIDVYFGFLNCGFRLPAVAGSDLTAVKSSLWAGYNRFYVKMDGPMDYAKWKQAVRDGKTFVTNQPLLFVTVNGQDPGAEFKMTSADGKPLEVDIEIFSATPVSKVQIISNGKVVQEVPVGSDATHMQAKAQVDMPASGWLVVRCTGASPDLNTGPKYTFAQTSPWYVLVDDKPIQSPADAKLFRQVLTNRLEEDLKKIENPAVAEELKKMVEQALAKYPVE